MAFDCFGTIFDVSDVPRQDRIDYGNHVRTVDFSPFNFSPAWYAIKAHADSAKGIQLLQASGIKCVTLSNGSVELLTQISASADIHWDLVIDLTKHRVYKPNPDAYLTVEKELGFKPRDTLMVTANPLFGDVEKATAIGMQTQIIRHGYPDTVIELADLWLM